MDIFLAKEREIKQSYGRLRCQIYLLLFVTTKEAFQEVSPDIP